LVGIARGLVDVKCVFLNALNDLLRSLTQAKLVLNPAEHTLDPVERVLDINFVGVIVLEQVVGEVIVQLQGEHIFFQRNQVHNNLRDSVLIEKIVFVQLFIAFDSASRNKEDMHFLVVLFLPVVSLIDDLVHGVQVGTHDEDDCLCFRLVDILGREGHLLSHFTRVG
jgi:hypothetical protein